uniref:Nephrocystin 3-like N-terminal domain-containing protein n=2 Tax=Podospora anserina (strain S / ATCC MYA-4624 / DSM 980 / FGSC 10383) TaxID=515849 RepID=A0A090CNF1_PODAN|nr:Putative protein of unknown function [Podospora anserina S mat+]
MNQFYEKEDSKEILRWLDPPNPSQRQFIASSKRKDDTGAWFVDNNENEFWTWKESLRSVLWIQGRADLGFSFSGVWEDCSLAWIAYFYFDFTDASTSQNHHTLVRSLIVQLSAQMQNRSVTQPLKTLYKRHRNGTTQPTVEELCQTLRNIIELFSPCYLVIDAVDESKEKVEFLKLLNIMVGQWKLPQLRVLLTSRTELGVEIPKRDWDSRTISIESGVGEDVKHHVLATLSDENGMFSDWNSPERDKIAESLIEASHGNFRWVACQLQVLWGCHTIQELDEALKSLPATLEEIYERELLTVEERRSQGFRHILQWLCYSKRPLKLDEMAEVFAIDQGTNSRPHYDPRRRLVNATRFIHKHSNLVSVVLVKSKGEPHKELRLAHLSVRDYLIGSKIVGSPAKIFHITELSAHQSIAEACIVYLQQIGTPENSPKTYPLARYAAQFWSYHVHVTTTAATTAAATDQSSGTLIIMSLLVIELITQVLRVFGLSPTISQQLLGENDVHINLNCLCVELLTTPQKYIRYFDPDTPWIHNPDISRSVESLPSALYYAAHAGLADSVRQLLAQGLDVDAVGGRYGTALQAAACKGHRDVIKVLLAKGAQVNQYAGDYGYALQGACCYGHEECATLLIDHGADVDARGGEHHTALHAAAFNGYEKVVKLLAERGATIDVTDSPNGRTALIDAAREGQTTVVERLLQLGANSLIRDMGGWTALNEAAPAGFDAIVRILIEHNPSILTSRDPLGYSALDHTAGQHHVSTVRLLLEMGIDVNSKTNEGRTALFRAVKLGNRAVVDLLIKHGAVVSLTDRGGWSALHIAAHHGQVEAGEALLQAGAPIHGGPDGWTPLHISILRKRTCFVKLLLESGADAQAKTVNGVSVMDCVDLHHEYLAEPEKGRLKIDNMWLTRTGLRSAASHGRDARIRELLDRGADIDARDEGGFTALMWAVDGGHLSTVRLLVENGADLDARSDQEGNTALMLAAMQVSPSSVMHLLVEHGADVNVRNNDGESAMGYLDKHKQADCIKLLCEYGYREEETPREMPVLDPSQEVLQNIRKLLEESINHVR